MSATALRGKIVLGVDLDRLALDADLPLERGADVVGAVVEAQAEHLADRAADRLLGLQAGELERAAAAVDDPPVRVAGEERRVRRRVVVVEQLEQVGEPALLAAAGLTAEAGVAVGGHRPVAAVGADEVVLVRHRRLRIEPVGATLVPRATCSSRKFREGPAVPGGSRPRWLYARRVAARPRGVRSIRPRWSR